MRAQSSALTPPSNAHVTMLAPKRNPRIPVRKCLCSAIIFATIDLHICIHFWSFVTKKQNVQMSFFNLFYSNFFSQKHCLPWQCRRGKDKNKGLGPQDYFQKPQMQCRKRVVWKLANRTLTSSEGNRSHDSRKIGYARHSQALKAPTTKETDYSRLPALFSRRALSISEQYLAEKTSKQQQLIASELSSVLCCVRRSKGGLWRGRKLFSFCYTTPSIARVFVCVRACDIAAAWLTHCRREQLHKEDKWLLRAISASFRLATTKNKL